MNKKSAKNRFNAPANWSAQYLSTNPIFSELCQLFPLTELNNWPTLVQLNHWLGQSDYRLVDDALLQADGRYYEAFIFATSHIPTRAENWHDLFGGLIWGLFPKTKRQINQLHISEMAIHGQQQRSKIRNKLTLLDECGVLIALEPSAQAHRQWLQQHAWRRSFWQQRHDWQHAIVPVIFGHAIYEMATQPFIGLTAKTWFIDVPTGFSQWALTDRYTFLDEKLSQQIANTGQLLNNDQLTPLPLLGLPGWYADNNAEVFYANTEYFRPRKTQQ
ncbi:DUF3025 domain-containing protein [Rheinheimera sp. UJ51]|uniref:DUF3025 domain-containing protein n=1 Tax=Rheinheimera sp. UJ51 TaxID=2892446 RepID=UPI001E5BAD32|nr:DUF3025 domain-containing protein [Rheinheimera sp. UJ51]MCC5450165.1 DUF3025 domain-containing protein [Rheinheimera sp. UJ51]